MAINLQEEADWLPGVAVDRRTDSQRERAASSAHGDIEGMAARVIARALGERVELVDDGSRDSLVDGRIIRSGRIAGVFEVVTDTDEQWAQTYQLVRARGFQLHSYRGDRRWHAWLSRGCKMKELDAALPNLLLELERQGATFEHPAKLDGPRVATSDTERAIAALGVSILFSRQRGIGESASIQLVPEGTGGYPPDSWEGFQNSLSDILHGEKLADVRLKLERSESDERHAFVVLTMTTSWELNFWFKDTQRGLPPDPPDLPGAVTHLWLWGLFPLGRVLAWFPDGGWFDPSNSWATS